LVALAGCGRVNYEPIADASDDSVDAADGAVVIDAGPCSATPCEILLPQCGCASNQMCQRTGATTDERGCVPLGTVTRDNVCMLDSACEPGHLCLANTTNAGACHLYCNDDADCAPGIECAKYDEGVGLGVCGSACTLEGGCPAGTACKVNLTFDFNTAGGVALPFCGDPGGGPAGAACGSAQDCAAGTFCDEMGVCRTMCRQDGSLLCATGTCTDAIVPIRLDNMLHGFCR